MRGDDERTGVLLAVEVAEGVCAEGVAVEEPLAVEVPLAVEKPLEVENDELEAVAEPEADAVGAADPLELPQEEEVLVLPPVALAVWAEEAEGVAVSLALPVELAVELEEKLALPEVWSLRPRRSGGRCPPWESSRLRLIGPTAPNDSEVFHRGLKVTLSQAVKGMLRAHARALHDASSAYAKEDCTSAPLGSAGLAAAPSRPTGYATSASIAA